MELTSNLMTKAAATKILRAFGLERDDITFAFKRADTHRTEWTSVSETALHMMSFGGDYKLAIKE